MTGAQQRLLEREEAELRALVGQPEDDVIFALYRMNDARVMAGLPPKHNIHNWRWEYALEAKVREILCALSKQGQSGR